MKKLIEALERIANWPEDDAAEIRATEARRIAREALAEARYENR